MFLELSQWIGGLGLLVFGLDMLASQLGGLIETRLSAWSERHAGNSLMLMASGFLAGMGLQGRRGLFYLKKRRLSGLLTKSGFLLQAGGMAGGMLLPAALIAFGPAAARFPALALGLLLSMLAPGETWPRLGRALTGLGCAWVGYVAAGAFMNLPGQATILAALGATAVLSLVLRLPAPLWLMLMAHVPADLFLNAAAWAVPACAGGWIIAVLVMMRSNPSLTKPRMTVLDYRDTAYPERALQAVLRDLRRMAEALSASAQAHLPALLSDKYPNSKHMRDMELAVNEFKPAAQRFLHQISQLKLVERQALLALHLDQCISDLERIGDHLYALAQAAPRIRTHPGVYTQKAEALIASTLELLQAAAFSLSGRQQQVEEAAAKVLEMHEKCRELIDNFRTEIEVDMEEKRIDAGTGVLRRELLQHSVRLTRHIRAMAHAEQQHEFWIDPDRIHERSERYRVSQKIPRIEQEPYLVRINTRERGSL